MSISLTRLIAVAFVAALPLAGCAAADEGTAAAGNTAEKSPICSEVTKALDGVTKTLTKGTPDAKALQAAVDGMRTKFSDLADQAGDTELAKALKEFAQGTPMDGPDALLKFSEEMNELHGKACA
ncbi:hypothetical protein [Sphaerimonospora thailandensis]|nr:hypothetical protein [Sphaerimonospora thailandensis]